MRTTLIIASLLFIAVACSDNNGSDDQSPETKTPVNGVELFEEEGKFGLKSTEGDVVWPAEYDFARKVKGYDLYWLGKGNRLFEEDEKLTAGGDYYLINNHGEQVNERPYKDIGNFINGIVWVEIWAQEDPEIESDFGIRRGVIDTAGKVVLDFIYPDIQEFNECGLARIAVYDRVLLRKASENRFVVDDRYRFNYGFIDTMGNIAVQPKFDYLSAKFYNNRCVASRLVLEDDYPVNVLHGYIDEKGEVVIDLKYGAVNGFEDGKAEVYDELGNKIVIDTAGNCLEGCQNVKIPS